MILGQAASLPAPIVAWSAFAPELIAVVGALTLLLLAVAGRRRMIVAGPVGFLAIAYGAQLITADSVTPGAVTVAFGAGLLAFTLGLGGSPQVLHAVIGGWTAAAALVLTGWQAAVPMQISEAGGLVPTTAMEGSLALDGIALFTRITVYATVLLVLPLGHAYLRERGINRPEFEPLVLLAAIGMAALGAANDLITLFVALEIMSISLYILAGMARRDRRSQEAAIKYFVMGAVASAILLYGMALLYVATGSMDLTTIGSTLALWDVPQKVAVAGLGLVTVGLGFKVAIVPFQAWTPDVYEGSPTNVTAFMAAATKAAAFAAVLRMFYVALAPMTDYWIPILAVLGAITMLYGALAAVVQGDVKRILAYSAIAHAGYAVIGVVSGSRTGLSATLWYLLTYAISTVAAFGIVMLVERSNRRAVTLADLRGFGRTSPFFAGLLSVALLSLAGIPPTVGFVGKLAVFRAGLDAGLTWLVIVGVVSSVIAAFFYLRIMGMMFLEEPEDAEAPEPTYSLGWMFSANLATFLVVVLGVVPSLLLDLASDASNVIH